MWPCILQVGPSQNSLVEGKIYRKPWLCPDQYQKNRPLRDKHHVVKMSLQPKVQGEDLSLQPIQWNMAQNAKKKKKNVKPDKDPPIFPIVRRNHNLTSHNR